MTNVHIVFSISTITSEMIMKKKPYFINLKVYFKIIMIKNLACKAIDDFGVSDAILLGGANSGQNFIKNAVI